MVYVGYVGVCRRSEVDCKLWPMWASSGLPYYIGRASRYHVGLQHPIWTIHSNGNDGPPAGEGKYVV